MVGVNVTVDTPEQRYGDFQNRDEKVVAGLADRPVSHLLPAIYHDPGRDTTIAANPRLVLVC